ncbi:MAG: hypothetical protein PVI71_08035 [Desulfobacterales bacterium]|jgi:hypothetical protein
MKKILLVVVCFSLLAAINAYSAEIAWLYVQHRAYGEGGRVNRLGFGLIDDRLSYLTSDSTVSEVKLYNPQGKEVKLAPHRFGKVNEIYGSYDSKNSQWRYDKKWQFDSWFHVDILEELIPGKYRLSIKTADGKTTEREYVFNRRIDLPFVDQRSVRLQKDPHGNLIWTWDVPEDMGFLAQKTKTRARAAIEIYKSDENVAYFSIILPSHMGYVFIPGDVAQLINAKGDRFELKISLETRDKNNRTYSKPHVFNEELKVVSR